MAPEPQTTVELPEDHPHIRAHRRRGLVFIGLAVGGVGFAMAIQMATNANFVADVIGISGLQCSIDQTRPQPAGPVLGTPPSTPAAPEKAPPSLGPNSTGGLFLPTTYVGHKATVSHWG